MVFAEEPNVKIIDTLVVQILPLDSRLDLICFCITLYIMCSSIGLYYSQSMHRSLLVSVQQVVQPVLPPIPSPPLHRYPPMLFSCSLPPHLPNMHSYLLCHVRGPSLSCCNVTGFVYKPTITSRNSKTCVLLKPTLRTEQEVL